jgi:poly(hydroxyalkanoate) granule-associated protein
MARTKRTARTVRTVRSTRRTAHPASRFDALRATANQAIDTLRTQGTQLRDEGVKLAAATARQARRTLATRADEARTRGARAMSQLEHVFERRVSGVISRLGVPTARDVRALSRQVAHLQETVERLSRKRA